MMQSLIVSIKKPDKKSIVHRSLFLTHVALLSNTIFFGLIGIVGSLSRWAVLFQAKLAGKKRYFRGKVNTGGGFSWYH